jgi:hypothetical protein
MSETNKNGSKRGEPLSVEFALDMLTSAISYAIEAGVVVRATNRAGVAWIALEAAQAVMDESGALRIAVATTDGDIVSQTAA